MRKFIESELTAKEFLEKAEDVIKTKKEPEKEEIQEETLRDSEEEK